MAKVLELDESKQTITESGMRIFFEAKRDLGICLSEFESFGDYMAALLERVSTGTLKGALRLPGDTFDPEIEKELRKREVYV